MIRLDFLGARGRAVQAGRTKAITTRSLFSGFLLSACLGAPAGFAQVSVQPGALELEREQGVAGVPGDGPDREVDAADATGREFVIAPLPSRSPLLGWTLSVPVLWLYKPDSADSEDKTWITGAVGFYTENDSLGGGLFHRMSVGGDRWRIMGAGFTADLNYDYFGIGGEPDRSIPLTQNVDYLLAEGLRRISPGLFLGLRGQLSRTATGIDLEEDLLPPGLSPGDLTLDLDLHALVPRLVFDTRDNQFFPREGWQVEGDVVIARDAIGSDVDYEVYKGFANRYLSLTDRSVLALRVATKYATGDTPFFLYPAFGAEADLRGYQTGTYRDQFLFATQAEWRQSLSERWRAVAFAGIGTVAPEAFDWGRSLPSIGFGVRWVVAPKNDLSLRFDVAWGRGDSEFYVGIGEAF
jgi:hypothetical protein